MPAVIVLHGVNGNGQQIEQVSGMSMVADTGKFVAAYPDEYPVDGVTALIDELVANRNVDPARVFVTGISRGGIFTEGLGCKLSGKLAAIAPLSGGLQVSLQDKCTPVKPLPVMLIHGTADPIVPYDGGMPRGLPHGQAATVMSAPDTFAFWRGKDACTGDTTTTDVAGTDATVTLTAGPACDRGAEVRLYSVIGGGHTWPGGATSQQQYVATLGPLNTQFDASQQIWDFFATVK
ncbi:esterase [Nocardia uniformis]|uniref:Esterase n=1 Tax=Nocardia uniformis TaxID=53432 RepID=A0A849C0F7_9NOCA|nr:hypothetical protein [Nocardia uniformis]NNH70936.1 esterase [Nocardia uniformis]